MARDLALWFCRSLLPFDFSEDEGTNDFMKVKTISFDVTNCLARHEIILTVKFSEV